MYLYREKANDDLDEQLQSQATFEVVTAGVQKERVKIPDTKERCRLYHLKLKDTVKQANQFGWQEKIPTKSKKATVKFVILLHGLYM